VLNVVLQKDEMLVDGVVTKQRQVVGICVVGEMFGEKTFLFGGSSTASVYADSEGETEVRERRKRTKIFVGEMCF
jgi:CRP-like cAMP-binding protein